MFTPGGTQVGSSGALQVNIPNFNGKSHESIENWLFRVEEAFVVKNVAADHQVSSIVSYLGEGPFQWYCTWRQHLGTNISTWTVFKEAICMAFREPNYEDNLRDRLSSLKQTGDIRTYVTLFRSLLGQVSWDMAERDKIGYFREGLTSNNQDWLKLQNPATLEDAINQVWFIIWKVQTTTFPLQRKRKRQKMG